MPAIVADFEGVAVGSLRLATYNDVIIAVGDYPKQEGEIGLVSRDSYRDSEQ